MEQGLWLREVSFDDPLFQFIDLVGLWDLGGGWNTATCLAAALG